MSEDLAWLGRAVLATMFAIIMGVLAAFVWGYIMIHIILETFFVGV